MMKKVLTVFFLGILLVGCDVFDKAAINEYEAATKRWNAGDYQTAVTLYFALVKEHPNSSKADDALYWAGVTQFLYLGETEKALQTLRLLLKQYPNRDMAPHAQWYIAQIYELGHNDYERAIEEYRKSAAYANREVQEKSLYGLAECLFRAGKVEDARNTWTKQVTTFPNGPQSWLAYFRLGTAAFSKGDIESAKSFYRKVVAGSPDKDLVLKAKSSFADCLVAEDNLGEALQLYKEIEPENPNREAIQIKIRALETRIMKKRY